MRVKPVDGTLQERTTPLCGPDPSVRHPAWTMGSAAAPSPAFGSGDVVAAPAGIGPTTRPRATPPRRSQGPVMGCWGSAAAGHEVRNTVESGMAFLEAAFRPMADATNWLLRSLICRHSHGGFWALGWPASPKHLE